VLGIFRLFQFGFSKNNWGGVPDCSRIILSIPEEEGWEGGACCCAQLKS
jgi:hypothetical protein